MSAREERVARNEATARHINEVLEEAQSADGDGGYLRIVCECGVAECEEIVAVTEEEYERVRSDPLRFIVRHGHVDASVEQIVEETDRFVVVAKLDGTASAIAEAEDPRG